MLIRLKDQFNINTKAKKSTLQKWTVACGICAGCKLRRVQEWVFRLKQEDKVSASAYFVTLTYAPHAVPISDKGYMTLSQTKYYFDENGKKKQIDSDLQRFFKLLRKREEPRKLKFYAAAEYGTERMRPHYHIILFNLSDAVHIGYDKKGNKLFQSENILKSWMKDDVLMGDVYIGQVSGDSIAYTAKYIDKAKKIPLHKNDDRVPEYSRMSKDLGSTYVTPETIKYHNADLTRNYMYDNGNKIPMSRYYRNKFYSEHTRKKAALLTADALERLDNNNEYLFNRKYPNQDWFVFKEAQRYYRNRNFLNHNKNNRSHD